MNFNYFNIVEEKSSTGAIYPVATPIDGLVDVYTNHHWGMGNTLDEVPNIILKEYKLEYGRWTSSIVRALQTVKSLINSTWQDPYKDMYLAEETGFVYNLPYMISHGENIRSSGSNEWQSSDGGVFQIFKSIAPELYKFGNMIGSGMASGWGAEPLISYKQTSRRELKLKFSLYNTLDVESANDNFSFVTLFNFQNLKTRTSWTTYLPPKMYSVETAADGGIYMPLAYVKSYSVIGHGQLRNMNDFGSVTSAGMGGGLLDFLGSFSSGKNSGRLVPEEYIVEITLSEVLPESVNIMIGSLGKRKVTVTKSPAAIQAINAGSSLSEVGTQTNSLAELDVPVRLDPKLEALINPTQALYGKPLSPGTDKFERSGTLDINGKLTVPPSAPSLEGQQKNNDLLNQSVRTKGLNPVRLTLDENNNLAPGSIIRDPFDVDRRPVVIPYEESPSQASAPASTPENDDVMFAGLNPGPGFITKEKFNKLPGEGLMKGPDGTIMTIEKYRERFFLPIKTETQIIDSRFQQPSPSK